MRGGAGADAFVFASIGEAGRGAGSDAILDFEGGADSIDLRAIDADRQAAGNQAFRWLGSEAFDGEGGALRFDGGRLAGDVNGDGRADFAIRLEGVHAVAASDILL
jgi:hypothetical protein